VHQRIVKRNGYDAGPTTGVQDSKTYVEERRPKKKRADALRILKGVDEPVVRRMLSCE
jgi:hypothetical protein